MAKILSPIFRRKSDVRNAQPVTISDAAMKRAQAAITTAGGAPTNQEALDVLQLAIDKGDAELVIALIDSGMDIEVATKDHLWGWTPLQWAAMSNQTKVAVALVNKGADIMARDKNGMTALHHAALTGSVQTTYALIEMGADTKAKCNRGYTPLQEAMNYNKPRTADILRAARDLHNAQRLKHHYVSMNKRRQKPAA